MFSKSSSEKLLYVGKCKAHECLCHSSQLKKLWEIKNFEQFSYFLVLCSKSGHFSFSNNVSTLYSDSGLTFDIC